jgi:hypothetical protein
MIAGHQVVKLIPFSDDTVRYYSTTLRLPSEKGKRARQRELAEMCFRRLFRPTVSDSDCRGTGVAHIVACGDAQDAECTIRECGEEGRIMAVIGEVE